MSWDHQWLLSVVNLFNVLTNVQKLYPLHDVYSQNNYVSSMKIISRFRKRIIEGMYRNQFYLRFGEL